MSKAQISWRTLSLILAVIALVIIVSMIKKGESPVKMIYSFADRFSGVNECLSESTPDIMYNNEGDKYEYYTECKVLIVSNNKNGVLEEGEKQDMQPDVWEKWKTDPYKKLQQEKPA